MRQMTAMLRTKTGFGILLSLFVACQSLFAQDPRTLLHKVSQRYQDPRQFHIEAVEETVVAGEMSRSWTKKIYVLAAASGCRYYFEVRTQDDWVRAVSDGVTDWTEQPAKHIYTSHPTRRTQHATGETRDTNRCEPVEEDPAPEARQYLQDLAKIAERIQSIQQLPNETISVNLQRVPCTVLQVEYHSGPGAGGIGHSRTTYWIDQNRQVIVKKRIADTPADSSSPARGSKQPTYDAVTVFPVAIFGEDPSQELFHLRPEKGEQLVDSLSNHWLRVDLRGRPAPPLRLKTLNGSTNVDLQSFQGRPVLVDFWATWCWSCHKTMEVLNTLQKDLRPLGLVILGVNKDENTETALKYLADHNYDWINLYDERSEATEAWSATALPLLVLIDGTGTVVFYDTSVNPESLESGIRQALEKPGPPFAQRSSSQ